MCKKELRGKLMNDMISYRVEDAQDAASMLVQSLNSRPDVLQGNSLPKGDDGVRWSGFAVLESACLTIFDVNK